MIACRYDIQHRALEYFHRPDVRPRNRSRACVSGFQRILEIRIQSRLNILGNPYTHRLYRNCVFQDFGIVTSCVYRQTH